MAITTRTPTPAATRWAQAEAQKNQKKKSTWRRVFYSVAAVVAAVLIGIAIWELAGAYKTHKHQQLLDALKKDPAQIQAAVDSHQITDKEGWRIRGETFQEQREQQMGDYFALTTSAERSAWMQKYINDEPERRAEMRKQWMAMGGPTSRPATRPSAADEAQAKADRVAQRVARYESRDPNRSAQMHQFFGAMLEEMKQMGLPAPHYGRHR